MKPLFIVDIDGTVCDSSDLVSRLTKRFKTHLDFWNDDQVKIFMDQVAKKKPIPEALELTKFMLDGFCDVIFLTGRSEKVGRSLKLGRRVTTNWLSEKLGMPKDIPLFMRPPKDVRPSDVIKCDVFERMILPGNEKRTFIFLDDDIRVINRYKRYGLALRSPECWKAMILKDICEE